MTAWPRAVLGSKLRMVAALVLMNDPTYVEAARRLSERVWRHEKSDADRLRYAFRLALAR